MSVVERTVEIQHADPLELIPVLPDEPVDVRRAILLRAAEVVEERGWTKGTWEAPDGSVCFLGAIGVAAKEHGIGTRWDDPHMAVIVFTRKFPDIYPTLLMDNPYAWNDMLPQGGWRGRKTKKSAVRVAEVLRLLADGKTWMEATL